MAKRIKKVREILIFAAIIFFPIFFGGMFQDSLRLPKLILLGVLVSLVLVTFAAEAYFTGKITFARGRFDLPILIIVFSYVVSGLFITPNKTEAFFAPGNVSFIVGFGILYFALNTIEEKNNIKMAIIASSALIAIFILTSFLGVFDKIPQLPSFMKAALFNPVGDWISSTFLLLASVPFAILFLIKENKIAKKLVFAFCLIFILIASGISIFSLVSPDKKVLPVFSSFETNWAVAIDSIKESPLLGVGASNYLTAFSRFRPIAYNSSDIWQVRFSEGRSWYLTLITETGLLGALGIALLVITVIKLLNKSISIYKESKTVLIDPFNMALLVATLIMVLVFPGTVPVLLLLFVALSLNSSAKVTMLTVDKGVSLILLALVLFLGVKSQPVILAEAKFKQADTALRAGDGKATYSLLGDAINLNPMVDRYHASYAQVNFAIARSIVAGAKDTKDLTDDQKNTILQLIQQAIREGQNTVSLNPKRSANWQLLASIYQGIIGYANQADQFALESYNQAINLDPLDPALRVSLGGVYYSLAQYDNAISVFQLATYTKPDFANSYYNLAAAYAAKNDFDNAVLAMNKVISLVQKDSNDYKQAQTELDALKKKQQAFKPTTGDTNLTAPKKQEQAIQPKLQLPEGANPPSAPNLPSPSPLPTVSPTPKSSSSPTPTATPIF